MDNRRLFFAVLLSLAVLILWQYLFPAKPPVPPSPPKPDTPVASSPAPSPGAPGAPGAATAPAATASPEAPALSAQPPVAAEREEQVVLENDRERVVLSNRGAQLLSFALKEDRTAEGRPLELVRTRSASLYPYGLVGRNLAPLPVDGALFAIESRDPAGVSFHYNGPLGSCTKSFRFDRDGLLTVEISVPGRNDWSLVVGPGLRNPTAAELGSRYQSRSAIWDAGGSIETLDTRKAERRELGGAGLRWVGLEDSYYLTALIPSRNLANAVLQPVLLETAPGGASGGGSVTRFIPLPPKDQITKEQESLAREFLLVLRPEGDTLSVNSYWGAKAYERLAALPYGLEKSVDFGTFGIIARPLLAGLHWIYTNVVRNYGWAIVIMTVLIKIALLPLTHKTYVSMRRMQELNPKMQAIRDRYRGKMKDKQGRPNLEAQRKMNEEIMGLYRAEGVNPAGGCVPTLIQLPILFAFYRMLTAAVELRNAPWALWIHDLSTPDPYYVLPIVMSLTQFLQQRMTPMAADPAQRRMFMLMPFVMLFLFLPSPSGLVLYWLTNNILTILQQGVYNHLKQRAEA
ncbi:MAG TPA: membrane protein insertase YidC [Thermoanaerobaculia bacterium]|nr:membrane protein insertase YidC [Thermoanaerobaculia bacterium]